MHNLQEDLQQANNRLTELEMMIKNSSFQINLSRTELWIGRIFAIVLIASFVLLAYSFYLTNKNVAVIKQGLANVTPSDVLAAVNELKESSLTREETEAIVVNESVWASERDEWYHWKLEIDKKIEIILGLQEAAAKNLSRASEDGFYGRDFRLWLEELKKVNIGKDIIIPDYE